MSEDGREETAAVETKEEPRGDKSLFKNAALTPTFNNYGNHFLQANHIYTDGARRRILQNQSDVGLICRINQNRHSTNTRSVTGLMPLRVINYSV